MHTHNFFKRTSLVGFLLILCGCASIAQNSAFAGPKAFPGAEGFGRDSLGGRGGRVIAVTNLNDDGPGSLRDAVQAHGPRTIIFRVSGIIDLDRDLDINRGRVTIAGQTAPGDGITLRRYGLNVAADDVVIRFIRVRPGSDAGVETDAISISRGNNIIVDHCSTSWATDETLSIASPRNDGVRSIDNVTVQWSIISESLNRSVHSKGEHGYGSLLRGSGGSRFSMHHNLWAHHRARMPRPGNYFDAQKDPVGPVFEIRNNVFYNWGGKYSGYNADTESLARYDFVGNYYVAGPDSRAAVAFQESNALARLFFRGNWMDGRKVADEASLVRLPAGGTLADKPSVAPSSAIEPADTAYRAVLGHVGASLVRDVVDKRVIEDVVGGTGTLIDHVSQVGGWPLHNSVEAALDSDGDGMPDNWEVSVGLNAEDESDGPLDQNNDGYTNLEDYLNSLVPEVADD